ncbi:unnamed protein product [Rodentolepis nana]|uniref:HMG box domain-containing protein n=1 Tax=Rodentolepis nana TaxID=102285 RepID=A0A0R3TUS1_RODNA|nr:unnamed protein product [Rodentolepis nana]
MGYRARHANSRTKTPCAPDIRRAQTKSLNVQRAETRQAKFNHFCNELISRDIRQFEDIFNKFSVKEIRQMNSLMGVQWREIAKQQILGLNTQRLKEEKENSYLQNLGNLKHECSVKHSKDTSWLMMLLNQNGIDISALLNDIIDIMDKKQQRLTRCVSKAKQILAKLF